MLSFSTLLVGCVRDQLIPDCVCWTRFWTLLVATICDQFFYSTLQQSFFISVGCTRFQFIPDCVCWTRYFLRRQHQHWFWTLLVSDQFFYFYFLDIFCGDNNFGHCSLQLEWPFVINSFTTWTRMSTIVKFWSSGRFQSLVTGPRNWETPNQCIAMDPRWLRHLCVVDILNHVPLFQTDCNLSPLHPHQFTLFVVLS